MGSLTLTVWRRTSIDDSPFHSSSGALGPGSPKTNKRPLLSDMVVVKIKGALGGPKGFTPWE